MVSRVNILLLAGLLAAGIALTVRASEVRRQGVDAAGPDEPAWLADRGCGFDSTSEGGPRTDPSPQRETGSTTFPGFRDLGVSVQVAFAMVRGFTAEAPTDRVPQPQLLHPATLERVRQWLVGRTGFAFAVAPEAVSDRFPRGEVPTMLRTSIVRVGPPFRR